MEVHQVQGEHEQRHEGMSEYFIFRNKGVWYACSTGCSAVLLSKEVRRPNGQAAVNLWRSYEYVPFRGLWPLPSRQWVTKEGF